MDAHAAARDQARADAPRRGDTQDATSGPEARPGLPSHALAGLAMATADSATVHRSLRVGSSDDPAEVEAERTADAVVRLLRGASARPSRGVDDAAGDALPDVVRTLRRVAARVGAAGGAVDEATGESIDRLPGQREAPVLSALRALSGSATGRLSGDQAGAEPSAGMSQPARRAGTAATTIRRVLVEADGQPSDVDNLLQSYPEQAQEIRARHDDPDHRYHATAVSADAPLTFAPVGLPSGNRLVEQSAASGSGPARDEREEREERKEPKADRVLGPVGASTSLLSSGPSDAFRQFLRSFEIDKATPFLEQVGPDHDLGPKIDKGKKASAVAFVANILTIPKSAGVQPIIDAYAAAGMSKELYASFAMVIGVNRYRSVAGNSPSLVCDAVSSAQDSPFACSIVPFLWSFNWSAPFEAVAKAYGELEPAVQQEVLAYERRQLVQSTIPYGALREFITRHRRTQQYVAELSQHHKAVYVHLGDDDAVSLQTQAGKVMDGYAKVLTHAAGGKGALPSLVVGGYDLRLNSDPVGPGDLDVSEPGHVMSSLASRVDTWFRTVLSRVAPDLVYPTEPNLAFLAAEDGSTRHLDALLEPSPQDQKRLAKEEGKHSKDLTFSQGLLYGRETNEGGKLRKRISEVREANAGKGSKGAKSAKSSMAEPDALTTYVPELAIATASTRFTMADDDRRQHDPSQPPYRTARESALSTGGPAGRRAQLVEDILTIKQSHVGGLAKELAGVKGGGKYAKAIAADVKAYAAAMLLGTDLTTLQSSCKESGPYLQAMVKAQAGLAPIVRDLQALFNLIETPAPTLPTAEVDPTAGDLSLSSSAEVDGKAEKVLVDASAK